MAKPQYPVDTADGQLVLNWRAADPVAAATPQETLDPATIREGDVSQGFWGTWQDCKAISRNLPLLIHSRRMTRTESVLLAETLRKIVNDSRKFFANLPADLAEEFIDALPVPPDPVRPAPQVADPGEDLHEGAGRDPEYDAR